MHSLDKSRIPKHIAVIMDGNGRWAVKHGLPRLSGHNAGMKAMKEIVKKASSIGIKHLTVYAFSTENWKRSKEEVFGIFNLLVIYIAKELKELNDNNVIVNVLGDYTKLPQKANESIETAISTTKSNTGLQFNIALNYGSRDEIVRAVSSIAKRVKVCEISPEDINASTIESALYTNGIPDPELIIRTSGEQRLSNFLLWQSAYSELVFRDELWPDFTPDDFEDAIIDFQNRKRRYGGR